MAILTSRRVRTFIVIAAVLLTMATTLVFTSKTTHAASRNAAVSSTTYCATYYIGRTLWHGAIPVNAYIYVPMCFNFAQVWKGSWGPDCWENTVWGSTTTTWCGVYNNGGSYAEPGMNFTVFLPPWGPQFNCYLRLHVNNNGSYYTYGGC